MNNNKIKKSELSKEIQGYKILEVLGKGSFGKVFKVLRISDNKIYALKLIQKEQVKKKNLIKYVKNEIKIMQEFNNMHILKMYETFEDKNFLYLIVEYCNMGTL